MSTTFKYDFVSEEIKSHYNYNEGGYFLDKIEQLKILEENSKIYVKNLMKKSNPLELYIFNNDIIYKCNFNSEDKELIEFKAIKKKDIYNIEFTVNYENEYTLSFYFGNNVEKFTIDDVGKTYQETCLNTILELIKYFTS